MNGSFLDNCSSHRTMAVVFFSFFSNSRIQSLQRISNSLTPSGHHHYTFISSGDSSQGTNINTRTPFSGILITSSEATPTSLCGRAPTNGDERVHLQTAFRTLAQLLHLGIIKSGNKRDSNYYWGFHLFISPPFHTMLLVCWCAFN